MNEELRKKIDEYCASQAVCGGCIFYAAVGIECLASVSTTDRLTRLKALKRFKKEILGEESLCKVKQKDILDKAIEKFGELQLVKAAEECCELAHALNKYYHMKQTDGACSFNKLEANIVEEIVDVEIMIEQVKRILKVNNKDIELIKENEIERLRERL